MAIPFHPLAEIFPLMEGAEFDELVGSIKANGLRHPIVLLDEKILDGRNRYRACEAAGIRPTTEPFTGRDPVAFVIDENVHRRHLNESQRGMVAAKLATLRHGGDRSKAPIGALTQEKAAQALNVSERSVQRAVKIRDFGTPEQITAVERGEASVTAMEQQVQPVRKSKAQKEKPSDSHQRRVATMNMQADIWRRLREALDHLTSLPLPAEVAVIARFNDKKTKGAAVERKLTPAIEWLTEFSDAWNSRHG